MYKKYYFLKSDSDLRVAPGAAEAIQKQLSTIDSAMLSSAIKDAIPGRPASHSGVLELWFRERPNQTVSVSDLFENPVEISVELEGTERTVMRLPNFYSTSGIKGVYAFRRKPGMAVSDFQHYWWHNHGPIAALTEGATCYVQTHLNPDCYTEGEPAFDGVTELYWPKLDVALAALGSRQMTEDQGNDAKNFVELSSVDLMMTQQHMIISPWKETR